MIITILSEPRSGSTNLHYWLKKSNINLTSVFEPYNKISEDFITDVRFDLTWIDNNKNYIINEKYFPDCGDLTQLTSISDKVVCLFREDSKSQIESFIVADVKSNWKGQYSDTDLIIMNIETFQDKKRYMEQLKNEFKVFIEKNNFKTFSYEDLYYRGKIEEFKEYLGLKIDLPFPYGEKYRIENKIKRLI
jgi:hypothetical protein